MENILFDAFKSKNLDLKNHIVTPTMTQSCSNNSDNKGTNPTITTIHNI